MKNKTESGIARKAYETVIGLEVHVELSTRTKIFCACSTAFGAPPNTLICPVCMGMPGTLPVLNRRVANYAAKLGLALACEINRVSRFDRKNYFYPDNPQNYQISQLYSPIGIHGVLHLPDRDVRIHEIHMEEDAGKLIHDEETQDTLVDYNRAGVPLIEIVTEPDMRSADEVIAFLETLHRRIRYLGISDCRMNEGSFRVDVNLSVRAATGAVAEADAVKGAATYFGDEKGPFGTRTEMKNLNSFKAIRRAIESETDRQIAILERGGKVEQETRRWDDDRGASFSMRSKEDAMDYRYFPEPDLPPVTWAESELEEVRRSLPEMPEEKAARYRTAYHLSDYAIGILTDEVSLADFFEKTVEAGADPGSAANWLMGEWMRLVKEKKNAASQTEDAGFDAPTIDPARLAELIRMTDSGQINSTTAKEVFAVLFETPIDVKAYVEENGLLMVSDASALEEAVDEVLAQNPKSVSDYLSGKKKAIGFLVGQVMKSTGGKANPGMVREVLAERLSECVS